MKALTCNAARHRLHAYHDAELSVSDQIAVSDHLDWCDSCAAAFEELQSLRAAIRTATRQRQTFSDEDHRGLQHNIISRLKAEESTSLAVRLDSMFEDMRLVWAGLGATMAAMACIMMMLNIMRFVKEEHRPDSLAARVSWLASEANRDSVAGTAGSVVPVVVNAKLLLPTSGVTFAADSDADVVFDNVDAEFAIAGVVTREGRVENLELVHASSGQPVAPGTAEAKALRRFMTAVARGRYEPASVDGLPVAVNKVWLVANVTVHGNKNALDRPVSIAARKRVTSTDPLPGRSAA
jgi:hypothetical protein